MVFDTDANMRRFVHSFATTTTRRRGGAGLRAGGWSSARRRHPDCVCLDTLECCYANGRQTLHPHPYPHSHSHPHPHPTARVSVTFRGVPVSEHTTLPAYNAALVARAEHTIQFL
jgi:hypothetical protein